MNRWTDAVFFICSCVMLAYPVKSEVCLESICEFMLVVTEFRSMTFQNHADGNVYDVQLQENGSLNLKKNNFHLAVPNITKLSPDMVHTVDATKARNIILVNNLFPGPTLEVMEGAQVRVKVVNALEREVISIHWHGIHMIDNVWMDGVPYLTQCPIYPRQSFTYRFTADPPGTHFYHSHMDLQRLDGLFGVLMVHRKRDFGLMPYLTAVLSDWFQVPSNELQVLDPYDITRGSGTDHFNHNDLLAVSGDGAEVSVMEFWSGLINGRGRKGSNGAPLTVFSVKEGQKYRMHIVSAAGEFAYRVSIDEHSLTVIESDGRAVKPVANLESVIVFPGERYVIEIKANKTASRYWIRACSLRTGQRDKNPDGVIWEVKAILQYGNETANNQDPVSQRMNCTVDTPCDVLNCPWLAYRADFFPNVKCMDVSALRKDTFREHDLTQDNENEVDKEIFLNMAFFVGASINRRRMVMPGAPLFQDPSTWAITPCQDNYDLLCSHIINLSLNKTVQLVLMSNIFAPLSGNNVHHVMHIHGHSVRVVKIGYPVFDNATGTIIDRNKDINCDWKNDKKCINPYWTNPPDLNLDSPPLKDTFVVPAMGYTVVRFETNNPGYWLFHCHTALHHFEGMALVFNISHEHHPSVPIGFPTCKNFDFSGENFKIEKDKCSNPCESHDSMKEEIQDLSSLELLSTIAASCSSISLFLELALLAVFLKFFINMNRVKEI